MKRVHTFIAFILLAGFQLLNAQSVSVSGTVTSSEDGEPLPGVSILVKGTTRGTVTDLDGNYSIEVPSDEAVLVFSFISMKTQEIEVGGQTVIDVVLETDALGLDEVVVTAIGIRRNQRHLTYTVQKVDGEDIENKVQSDVLRALNGKVAGVNINSTGGAAGSSTSITIRGSSSMIYNNQPLFVVDGVPYDNTTSNTQDNNIHGSTYSNRALDIDPNDIESITVLKSASAAALYGSRAGNGAIIITTKSGQMGSGKHFDVSFSSSVAMEEPSKIPDYQNEYGQGANFEFNPGYFGTWGPRFDAPDLDGNGNSDRLLFDNNGTISYRNHLNDTVPYQAYPNNVSDFFEKGWVFENSLSLSGGDENTSYILSASALNHDGFIPNSNFDKYSVRIGGSQMVGDRLKLGGSLNYVNSKQHGVPIGGYGVTNTNTFGQLWIMPRSYNLSDYPYKDPVTQENMHYRTDRDNPYYIAHENPFTSTVDRIIGYVDADLKLTDWLNLTYKLGYNQYNDKRLHVYAKSTLYNGGVGTLISDNIRYGELESNLLLRANKSFGDIGIAAIAGWNINQQTRDRQSMSGSEMVVHGINDFDNVNSILPNGGDYMQKRLLGIFADLTLSYGNWAFLNLTGRSDWSSTLPKENSNYFYPSATGSVVLTDAVPLLKNNVLSFFKVYGGYSKVGNDAPAYRTATTYDVNDFYGNNLSGIATPFGGVPILSVGNLKGNPELKPEFTAEVEVGADMAFANSRIGLDVAYYSRRSTDLIFGVTIPASTGYISQMMNTGVLTNKGVELALNGTPVMTSSGLRWNIALNYSHNRSNVKELFTGVEQINVGRRFTNLGTINKVGYPYGVLEGSVHRRDDEGNLLINPATGYAMADNEYDVVADPNPDFISSVINNISFRGLNLSVLMEYRQGGEMYSFTIDELRGRGVVKETAVNRESTRIIRGVLADPADPSSPQLDGDGNTIPNNVQITTNNYYFRGFPAAEANVYDVTTVRLREVVLGYDLPSKWLENVKIKKVNVSLVGRNLWFYSPNIPHIDPETSGFSAGNKQGIDFYYMPPVRRYALAVKINF